jgi:flagellar motor switch protein FliG
VVGLHHTGAQVLAQLSSLLQHQVPRRVRDQDAAGALALEELTRRLRADLTGRRP